ncbi:helix-turn-helix domain-containing protein [Chromobacterium vaccinii]|uniref:HTH cro/C1-type domain-containing protein n=1 Tax=Chromobacterium vaccinii TaxID=1108595 RepID=A0A1D9LC48_9NEIS|nr:helix-turn-helix transcriptional regulator [Chromobacterium vaccinii]AOZ48811.1 hypothetical protein BKX93_01570 [Chromobacterium vaccinii]
MSDDDEETQREEGHGFADVFEVRKEKLFSLVARRGATAELASKLGIKPNYLSQVKNDKKRVGELLARKIEAAVGKPRGWMDFPGGGDADVPVEPLGELKDVYGIRRDNLMSILAIRGMAAKLASEVGTSPSYLSTVKSGERRCGDEIARKIEVAAGLPNAWLDNNHATVGMLPKLSDEKLAEEIRHRGPLAVLSFIKLLLA